jgi:hypothetical protein
MTKKEFFETIPADAGAIIKIKKEHQEYLRAHSIRVVPKVEWCRKSMLTWEPDEYLEFQFMGGENNGQYNGWSWRIVDTYLDFSSWKNNAIISDIYCSCGGPAKKSTMLYGDLFYICTKCKKEKR